MTRSGKWRIVCKTLPRSDRSFLRRINGSKMRKTSLEFKAINTTLTEIRIPLLKPEKITKDAKKKTNN